MKKKDRVWRKEKLGMEKKKRQGMKKKKEERQGTKEKLQSWWTKTGYEGKARQGWKISSLHILYGHNLYYKQHDHCIHYQAVVMVRNEILETLIRKEDLYPFMGRRSLTASLTVISSSSSSSWTVVPGGSLGIPEEERLTEQLGTFLRELEILYV